MRRLAAAAILAALFCTPAFAADRHWTGRLGASWSNPANWDPEGVPSATESIEFPGWPTNRNLQFDLPTGSPVGAMTFLGDYTIGGNLMTLTGDVGIVSSPEAVPVTFDNNLKIGKAVRFLGPFQLTVNGAIDVNGQTLRMGTTYATLLKGPLNGSGTLLIDPRGVSLLGGGNFSGTVQGNAWVAGSYPNATFSSPWLTGTGTTGATTAKLVSPGEWQPWLYHDPHELGTLRTGSLAITGQYSVDVVPGGADKIAVTGSVSVAGALVVTIDGAAPVPAGSSYTIIANDGTDPVTGTFADLPEGATITAGSATFRISYRGGDGNDVVLNAGNAPARAATSTSIAQNRATTEEHQPVTFTATVAAASGTPDGTISFFDGSLNFGTIPLTNGSASLTVIHLTIGTHSISAMYSGSNAFDGSTSAPIVHAVVKGTPHVTITSSASTIVFGDPVTYAIAVTATTAGASTPTGTIALTVDDAPAGNSALEADGTARITVRSMAIGTHTVTATYSGDASFDGASASLTQSVTAASSHATSTSLTQNRATTEEHQPVTFTATVRGSGGIPSGTVSFFDAAQNLGTIPLEDGSASLTVKTLAIGTHSITATYGGSSAFDASASSPLVHNVVKGNPHVTIAPPAATLVYGDAATFAIAVTADAGTPTGSVSVTVDGKLAGNAALNANGAATITLPSLAAGMHTVAASYSGDASFERAGASTTQTVAKAPTAVALRSQANPSPVGLPVSVDVQVSPTAHPALSVAGNVVVANGGQKVTEAQLIAGAAAVRVGPLSGGDYAISVTYGGDANFQGASATLTQHVARPALVAQSASLEEGDAAHDALVRISLTEAATSPVTVDYRTVDGTAKAGDDYLESHGTLLFDPGQTSAAIPIRILGDTTVEPDETFRIELANVNGAAVAAAPIELVLANDDLSYRPAAAYAFPSTGGATVRATFYAPAASAGPWPVILWIPGDTVWDGIGGDLAALRETARGYAVVSVAYRPAATAPFPAQVDDLRAAVRWLRANAVTLNVDPRRVVAWGAGAGGHLAALLGTGMNDPDPAARVDAVIDWGGISDLASLQADAFGCSTIDWNTAASPASQLLGCALEACPDAADAADPARYAARDAAPMLLMHGSSDCFVAPRQSARLADALSRAGADVTLRIVDFAGHADSWWTSAAAFGEVDAFLDAKWKGGRGRSRAVGH